MMSAAWMAFARLAGEIGRLRFGTRIGGCRARRSSRRCDCGCAHEGEEIEAVVDGICIADFPEETVAALKMSIRVP